MQDLIQPNPNRVRKLRNQVREKLYTSMHHMIFELFVQNMPSPIAQTDLRDVIMNGARFPNAALFALHGVLLDAALKRDNTNLPEAYRILGDLANRETGEPVKMRVDAMSGEQLHQDEIWLLQRAFADDIGLTASLSAPPDNVVAIAADLVAEAMGVLEKFAPAWGQEQRLLANQVYLAASDNHDTQLFVGAAVFDAFGAILLNPFGISDLPSTLMALIHESSHQQMFLYHLDDPIVLNDANETYGSPLRIEPRPMEGIFHAMWVSARMALVARSVLEIVPQPKWADGLARRQESALRSFRDCEQTVAAHAELSDFGTDLFSCARNAVDEI